jgi:hypothetical protein
MRDRGRSSGEGPEGGQEAGRSEVGSVAEEAAKLFGALNDWATQSGAGDAGTAAQHLAEGIRSAGEHVGRGEECRYCPLCQGIRVLRETSPEVREHLALAIGSLAQAATAALRQGDEQANDAASSPSPSPSPRRVDLDD